MNNHSIRARSGIMLMACFNTAALLFCCTTPPSAAESFARNPALLAVPEGTWVKIHQQRPGDAVSFERQRHGGSAFDSRRGQLVLFGSDTHGVPEGRWLNSPFVFDLKRLEWDQAYPADPVSSYRVTAGGLPVAGAGGDHPWAMHTFGAVTYDPTVDAIVVSSLPAHLQPGRFVSTLASVWPKVSRHPTWLWHPGTDQREPLPGEAVHFFPHATVYDSRRKVVLGYRSDGIYALHTAEGQWHQLAVGGLFSWGSNVAFDEKHGVLIAYGSHRKGNDIVVYDPASGVHRKMLTPGLRPAGSSYVPMAFHSGIGRTVVLISRRSGQERPFGISETWQYDYEQDSWTYLKDVDLPFKVGMNYNLEYDPVSGLLVLVATPPGESLPAVWVLKLGQAR